MVDCPPAHLTFLQSWGYIIQILIGAGESVVASFTCMTVGAGCKVGYMVSISSHDNGASFEPLNAWSLELHNFIVFNLSKNSHKGSPHSSHGETNAPS